MMMNNQNMMVFNVELGFTALPHLPDLPARGDLHRPRIKIRKTEN
jgi:hypothetical protein